MYPEEEGRRCGKDVAGPPRVMGEADSERLCAGSEGLGSREHLEKTKCTERLVLLNVERRNQPAEDEGVGEWKGHRTLSH